MFFKRHLRVPAVLLAVVMASLLSGQGAYAQAPGGGGTTPPATQADRFSGFGTVTSVDTTAKTVTVTITRASRLLKGEVGNPVTLQLSSTAVITPLTGPMCGCPGGCAGMGGQGGQGGMGGMGRRMGPGAMGPGGCMGNPPVMLQLTDVQQGDEVHFIGHFDAAAKQYVVERLMVWL